MDDNMPGVGSEGQQREDTTRTLGMLARQLGVKLSEPAEFANLAPIPRSVSTPDGHAAPELPPCCGTVPCATHSRSR